MGVGRRAEAQGPQGAGAGSAPAAGLGGGDGVRAGSGSAGRRERGARPARAPRGYLQPGGDSEWKVERENISARSAIFSGRGPRLRRGVREPRRAPRPRSARPAHLVTRPAAPAPRTSPGLRGGAGRAAGEAGEGRGRGRWLEERRRLHCRALAGEGPGGRGGFFTGRGGRGGRGGRAGGRRAPPWRTRAGREAGEAAPGSAGLGCTVGCSLWGEAGAAPGAAPPPPGVPPGTLTRVRP